MIWNTLAVILDALFVPVMVILFFTGLFTLLSGLRQVHKGMYREQQLSWYDYPNVLIGIGIMLLTLFFSFFIAAGHRPNAVIWIIIMHLTAIVCGCLSMLCMLRARQRASFLPPKRKQPKQAQPKD